MEGQPQANLFGKTGPPKWARGPGMSAPQGAANRAVNQELADRTRARTPTESTGVQSGYSDEALERAIAASLQKGKRERARAAKTAAMSEQLGEATGNVTKAVARALPTLGEEPEGWGAMAGKNLFNPDAGASPQAPVGEREQGGRKMALLSKVPDRIAQVYSGVKCRKQKPTVSISWPERIVKIEQKLPVSDPAVWSLNFYETSFFQIQPGQQQRPRGSSIEDVSGCTIGKGKENFTWPTGDLDTVTLTRNDPALVNPQANSDGVAQMAFENKADADAFYFVLTNLAAGRPGSASEEDVMATAATAAAAAMGGGGGRAATKRRKKRRTKRRKKGPTKRRKSRRMTRKRTRRGSR
jgi:hypothetical protein